MGPDPSPLEPDLLVCACPHCTGQVEFPAEMAGTAVDCPHCGDPLHLVSVIEAADPAGAGGAANGSRTPRPTPSGLTLSDLMAAFTGQVPRRAVRFVYRVRLGLVGLSALLLPAAYLALVASVLWGTSRFATGWFAWADTITGGSRFPTGKALIYVLGLFVGGWLGIFLCRPFFARRAARSQALALNPAAEPLVVTFVQLVCDAVGASHPIRVEVDCRPNASAGFRRGWPGWLRGDRVVTLGLPLVAMLDTRQLAGVLAHEFGHFNQGLGLRASHAIRAVNGWLAGVAYDRDGWDATLDRWQRETRPGGRRFVVGFARFGVGFSRGVLKLFLHAGHAFSCALLREMEFDADRTQIELSGSAAFGETFRRSYALQDVARDHYRELRARWNEQGELPANFPASLAAVEAALPAERRARLSERQLQRERELFDTHPPDGERLRRAREADAPGLLRLDLPATALFSDFDTLARQVTLLHYVEDLRLPPDRLRLAAR